MAAYAVAEYRRKLAKELPDVAHAGAHLHCAGLELRQVEDVVDEVEKRVRAQQDAVDVLLDHGLGFAQRAAFDPGVELRLGEEKRIREKKDALASIEKEIEQAEKEAAELALEMSQPGFWNDAEQAVRARERYDALQAKIESLYQQYEDAEQNL